MNTCQNPKCAIKFKKGMNIYCSMTCFRLCQPKLVEKRVETKRTLLSSNQKALWRHYWEVKLYKRPLKKITQEEYQTMDYINNFQRFENVRASIR